MAGKLYDGRDVTTAKNGVPQNSKAYCEGQAYRLGGNNVTRPKADNPNQPGSEMAAAWDAGWDAVDGLAGGTLSATVAGPCAGAGQAVPANP